MAGDAIQGGELRAGGPARGIGQLVLCAGGAAATDPQGRVGGTSTRNAISVLVLHTDLACGEAVARRVRGELGCSAAAATPARVRHGARSPRGVRIAVLADPEWWRQDPSRLAELLESLRGIATVVLAPRDEPELAVTAVVLGASEVLQVEAGLEPAIGAAVRLAAARWTRARTEFRRRAAMAAALTRSRSRNRRLDSLLAFFRSAALADPLTGLANRRALRERLESAIRSAQRHRTALSVLAIDVDNLKAVNDTLGHDAGDELLKTVAGVLRKGLRAGDVAARIGGDEFIVVLQDTSRKDAGPLAARLQTAFVTATGPLLARLRRAGSAGRPGLSIGIAARDEGERAGGDGLLTLADRALCDAKRKGKGRVEVTLRRSGAPGRAAA